MQVQIVDHPLAAARLTTLRDKTTGNAGFRAALSSLTQMLVYEALGSAKSAAVEIETPLKPFTGSRLECAPLLVPVLRAGLGMIEQALEMVPEAHVGFVGIARDEETAQPVPYLESLPDDLSGFPVFVLDPMLATGGTLAATIDYLVERGADDITAIVLIAAPEGLAKLEELTSHIEVPITLVTGAMDEKLNENGYIVPGLGDAGDRQFGAV